MTAFRGGAGHPAFARGYWPLDPKWNWMRKWLFASYDFTEGSGAPMPKAGIAKEVFGPAVPSTSNVPRWGFDPNVSSQFYTQRNQRAGNFGVLMDNNATTIAGAQYGYTWPLGIHAEASLRPTARAPRTPAGLLAGTGTRFSSAERGWRILRFAPQAGLAQDDGKAGRAP